MNGKVTRRNGSIILLDTEGNEKIRWNFFNAWPTKWDAPDFSAKGNDVVIETLELANEEPRGHKHDPNRIPVHAADRLPG